MASVSDGAVAFMLGDGTLKLHTLAMPIIEDDASELDFNESYTLTKLNKDEILKLQAGFLGDVTYLDTAGNLYGIEFGPGVQHVFSEREELGDLDRTEPTKHQEFKLITDDVKDLTLSIAELVVLKNNGDVLRFTEDARNGVTVASGVKEIAKRSFSGSFGLKEDGSIIFFIATNVGQEEYDDFNVEGTFDSIKYSYGSPILTKGDDEYVMIFTDFPRDFEGSDFLLDQKYITKTYESGSVEERGFVAKINYDKFAELGVGKIRYFGTTYNLSSFTDSGETEHFFNIIDEDNKGFLISLDGEVVRQVDVVNYDNIYSIIDLIVE